MKIYKYTLTALALSFAAAAQAQWQKFEDFEAGDLSKWVFTQSDVGTTADSSATIVVDPDPVGAAAGNHVMVMDPGSPFETDHRSRLIGKLSAPINYGTTGTLFYRWYTKTVLIEGTQFQPALDMNVGLSAVDVPTQYNESGPVTGYKRDVDQFRAYNGDPNPDDPAAVVGFQNLVSVRPDNIWVSQWYYIRNLSTANQEQDYQVYYRVGRAGTPVLAFPLSGNANEYGGFRAKPDGDLDPANAHLDVFYFTNSAGRIDMPQALDANFFADDIYVNQNGLDLTDPTGSTGGGDGFDQSVSNGPGGRSPATTKLANISVRGVITGEPLTPGFVITGTVTQQILLRAAGPSLADFGVSGTLTSPVIKLFRGQTQVAENAGWGTADNASIIASTASAVGAFPFASGSTDSALLIQLEPGAYTAQISGADGATGVVVIEVYGVE
jgi:hypothetical protein